MHIAVPPGPPDSTETGHNDIFEALIEEANQRARRRRRLYGVAACVGAFAVVAAVVNFNGARSSPAQPAAGDSAPESPVGDLGVFEPIRGLIVFPDEAGIGAIDPNNPSSRHTLLANPEGITECVAPLGWSPDGTQLALGDQCGTHGGSGEWIMDSTGTLNNVAPCCRASMENPWTPEVLKAALNGGSPTVLWRLTDDEAFLVPLVAADWITLDLDSGTTRKWEFSFIVGHTALSPDGQQLLLTAPANARGNFSELANSATNRGLYALGAGAFGHRNNLDPSTMRRIAAGSYLAAVWSPDSTQIAAISETPEGRELVVMNADGTDEHALIELPDRDYIGIAWHPLAPNE